MNIAICDNSLEYINIIENFLGKLDDKKLNYDVFLTGEDLVHAYECGNVNYDAIFLDMEMKQLNGIETAKRIKKFNEHVIIVFITFHTKYMKDSFECEPFRFLIKPVSFDDIKKVYNEISTKLAMDKKAFVFSENRNIIRLYCDDIIFFESQAHWVYVNTKDSRYRILKTMTEICNKIDGDMFFRVHNSYVVNFNYIKVIKDNKINLYDSEAEIPISRTYKKEFIKQFISFQERKYVV